MKFFKEKIFVLYTDNLIINAIVLSRYYDYYKGAGTYVFTKSLTRPFEVSLLKVFNEMLFIIERIKRKISNISPLRDSNPTSSVY